MTIIKILFCLLQAFAEEQGFYDVENAFVKKEGDPRTLQIDIIDNEKANSLFRKFIQDKKIPFKYLADACYAKATAMAQVAESEAIIMGKIYAEGFLLVKTNNNKKPIVRWGWHVAPMVYVKKSDESIELMVFDPSLFNKPVSVEAWKKRMMAESEDGSKGHVDRVYYGSRFQYLEKYEENKTIWSEQDVTNAKNLLDKLRVLNASEELRVKKDFGVEISEETLTQESKEFTESIDRIEETF